MAGPSDDGEVLLSLFGRLDEHPWIRTAEPETAEDAYSVFRARVALMGWDTTFSDNPGDRQELFWLLESELTESVSTEAVSPLIGRFRVQPTQHAAVHRYLPVIGLAVEDTVARIGSADVAALAANLPPAASDPQSLPYLLSTRNWFRAAPPGHLSQASVMCDGPSQAQMRQGLQRVGGRASGPFSASADEETIHLPEWSMTALAWSVAAITAAVREAGFTGRMQVRLEHC